MTLTKQLLEQHRRHLWPAVKNYYEDPVALVEGNGLLVKDAEGKQYLDFFGGILTVSLGHRQPQVNQAIHAQVDRILHTSTLYPSAPMGALAGLLARLAP